MPFTILHLLNSTSGGSALSTLELIEALKPLGVKSVLVCMNNGTQAAREKISTMVEGRALFLPLYWMNKKIRVRWWKRPFLEVLHLYRTWGGHKYQRQIQAFARSHQVQLIHTSTIVNPEGAIAARALGVPHVWHVRELIGPDKHFRFDRMRSWARWVQGHADVLVANSQATYDCMARYFDPKKIRLIPNAIDAQKFRKIQPATDKKEVLVSMIGSVTSQWKNHTFFLQVASACKALPHLRFVIWGELPGPDNPYYRTLVQQAREAGLEVPYFTFGGYVPATEVLQNTDILFHPTELESFGRIFTEALAAGLPVIGIEEGGATAMVRPGENGYLIPKNDVEAAKAAIMELAEDAALRARMGQAGRALVLQEYDLPVLATRMENLYETLVQ